MPSAQTNSSGPTWADGPTPGRSLPIGKFYVAKPTDSAATINTALRRGQNLLLTPGVYHLDQSIDVTRPDTVVLGLGFPTLIPTNGNAAMTTARAKGTLISGSSSTPGRSTRRCCCRSAAAARGATRDRPDRRSATCSSGSAAPTPGKATTSLVVNSDNVILDDIWAWRADHGNGVGWTSNTADTGVVVNGDHVTAYGLFVEHYQKNETIWNGNDGTVVFFQNEMPYDPPSQAAWMEAPGVDG